MNPRVAAVVACLACTVLLVRCGDRFTGPDKPGVIVLEVTYARTVESSGKLAEARAVDRMVVRISGEDGAVLEPQDMEAHGGRWRAEIELDAGTYLVELDAYRQTTVEWHGSTSVVVEAGRAVTAALTLTSTNRAPVANAGPDQAAFSGETVQLSGSGTDADGDALTYLWQSLDGTVLSSTTTARPTLTAGSPGTYRFTLTVNDGEVSSVSDRIVVTVTVSVNRAPVADAGPDKTVTSGDTVQLSGSGTDADGDALTYNWNAPGIILSLRLGSTPRFTAPQPGTYRITLSVNDGTLTSPSDEVVITVVAASVGATIRVAPGESIMAALNQARKGDTILLLTGTHSESIVLKDGVNLAGEGRDLTVLRWPNGTVISAQLAFDLVIRDLTIRDSGSSTRAAIHFRNGGAEFRRCDIIHNSSRWALFVDDVSARMTIQGGSISDNDGGGIGVDFFATVSVDGVEVARNGGIGLQANRAELNIENSSVRDNGSVGIHFLNGSSGMVQRSSVVGNLGYGIWIQDEGTSPVITGNDIRRNVSGGIVVGSGANPTISDNSGQSVDRQ